MALNFTTLPGRGRAVTAARQISPGEQLLCERPVASMQLPDNADEVRVCRNCLRPLGTISGQLQHAAGLRTAPELPLADDEDDEICEEVRCRNGSAATFCSKACESAANVGFHRYFCATRGPKLAALKAFEQHAMEEGENFLFGARLVTEMLARADALHRKRPGRDEASCTAEAREVLAPFCRGLWWEIAEPPPDLTPTEVKSFRTEMRDAASESLDLLRKLLFECGEPASRLRWLDLNEWGGMLGLARQNNICCELYNPTSEVVPMLRCHAAAVPSPALDALLARLPRALPDVMGTALYSQLACINHSCAPNAEVRPAPSGCAEALVVATRPIAPGTEVTISYIDANQRASVTERRRELLEYGFECACEKCEQEMQWKRRLRRRTEA